MYTLSNPVFFGKISFELLAEYLSFISISTQ